MEKSVGTRGQISEAVSTSTSLTSPGGFQDAHTYYCRGDVSANVQTGSIVLMGSHLAARKWNMALWYLVPVLAFIGEVYIAEHVKRLHRQDRRFYWGQLIVAIGIILLFVVRFLSQDMNMAVNIIVSFVCALQVNAFRKIKGSLHTITMCIGNPRSVTENLYWYRHMGQKDRRDKCIRYYGVTGMFAVGAVMGSMLTAYLRERTIWVSCGLLLVSFLIMSVKEDTEGGHV